MFRAYFIFDTPAIVLATEVRLGFFSLNISILDTLKLISQGKREYPGSEVVPFIPRERESTLGERLYRLYSPPGSSPLSRWRAGRRFIAKVGRKMFVGEMIDDLPDQSKKQILAKMAHTMACTMARRFGRPIPKCRYPSIAWQTGLM